MRSIVNVKDVLAEYQRTLDCPHCRKSIPIVQATLDFRKGAIFIRKSGICDTHGCISETRTVRAIQMLGKDAQIIPQMDDPQALAHRKNRRASDGADSQ